jgi:hypothetical protein
MWVVAEKYMFRGVGDEAEPVVSTADENISEQFFGPNLSASKQFHTNAGETADTPTTTRSEHPQT